MGWNITWVQDWTVFVSGTELHLWPGLNCNKSFQASYRFLLSDIPITSGLWRFVRATNIIRATLSTLHYVSLTFLCIGLYNEPFFCYFWVILEEMDYNSEGTVSDPKLTLQCGYDVDMDAEPEGENLHCCWELVMYQWLAEIRGRVYDLLHGLPKTRQTSTGLVPVSSSSDTRAIFFWLICSVGLHSWRHNYIALCHKYPTPQSWMQWTVGYRFRLGSRNSFFIFNFNKINGKSRRKQASFYYKLL